MKPNNPLLFLGPALLFGCIDSSSSLPTEPTGGGKADEFSRTSGRYATFIYEMGQIVRTDIALLESTVAGPEDGPVELSIYGIGAPWTAPDPTFHMGIVDVTSGFAEISHGGCDLILGHQDDELAIMQTSPCTGFVPGGMLLDGTYGRTAENMFYTYRRTAPTVGALTMTTFDQENFELAIGVTSGGGTASAVGTIHNVVEGANRLKLAADCTLVVSFMGDPDPTSLVHIEQEGNCASTGASNTLGFAGDWPSAVLPTPFL